MYDRILVALDGSKPSQYAGHSAFSLAKATGAHVIACHIYGADIHRRRFSDMEPGLPSQYQEKDNLTELRTAHVRLMAEGFQALSAGYVEDFTNICRASEICVESVALEGRSYVGILELTEKYKCDLIVLGADGLGAVGNGMLGGTTTRVLQNASCDVLVTRCKLNEGSVIVGIDGSDKALEAAGKAVNLANAMKKEIQLTAAYDPDFHTNVFKTMSQTLSPEDQEKAGLAGQEKLHDDIINTGLGKLYTDFLKEAKQRFNTNGTVIKTSLVTGKAYCALNSEARKCSADLIVVHRHGHHRQQCSYLGSNAEGLLRTTSSNVLLVGGVGEKKRDAKRDNISAESIMPAADISWDSDAENRLQRVPVFVRRIAKKAVENAVRQSGKDRVTVDDFDNIAARFGMGQKGEN